MSKPLIKPSHKGLLHKDLGIPQGEKIPKAKLESAKESGSPAVRKRANFAINFNDNGHHGVITGISTHDHGPSAGKFVRINVKHGAKPKAKKNGKPHEIHPYDDRPESTLYLPKKAASKYHIGQRVGAGLAALPDGEPEDGPDSEPDDDDMDPSSAEDSYRSTMRGILSGPKKRGGK